MSYKDKIELAGYGNFRANGLSIFDLVNEDELRRAVEQAREDFAAGRSVSHEVAAEWLERLAKGERPSLPISTTSTTKP